MDVVTSLETNIQTVQPVCQYFEWIFEIIQTDKLSLKEDYHAYVLLCFSWHQPEDCFIDKPHPQF